MSNDATLRYAATLRQQAERCAGYREDASWEQVLALLRRDFPRATFVHPERYAELMARDMANSLDELL